MIKPCLADMSLSSTECLEGRLSSVVGVLNRAHAQLVDIAAEALATQAWAGDGTSSPTHWLVLRAGLSRSRAAQVLEVARRRDELPVTLDALAAGELSLEQQSAQLDCTDAADLQRLSPLFGAILALQAKGAPQRPDSCLLIQQGDLQWQPCPANADTPPAGQVATDP